MRDLTELNINDGGKPVTRQPPSSAAISAFERATGLRIPAAMLELLRHSNGGHPELDSYNPNGVEDTNSFGINVFYNLTDDKTATDSLWEAIQVWRPYVGSHALPFAEDGGGNILFLDQSVDPASVKVCWHDENFLVGDMAPTFEALIDGLCENPEYI